MPKYHLAQINIAHLRAPLDHPDIAGFANNLDRINEIAESSKGFVWRLKDDQSNNATSLNPYNNEMIIVNVSVWESVDDLKNFAYQTDHRAIYKDRTLWFHPMQTPHMCLWWIPLGGYPTAQIAKEKLDYLTNHGASEHAFGFRKIYQPPN